MSAGAVVRFPSHPDGMQTFAVARPELLEVLQRAEALHWGYHIDCAGTREQLLAAGVATADMFEHLGKSGTRTANAEYGNWTMQRRAAGRFELTIRAREADSAEHIGTRRFQALKYWQEHASAVDAEVADALQRIRRTAGLA